MTLPRIPDDRPFPNNSAAVPKGRWFNDAGQDVADLVQMLTPEGNQPPKNPVRFRARLTGSTLIGSVRVYSWEEVGTDGTASVPATGFTHVPDTHRSSSTREGGISDPFGAPAVNLASLGGPPPILQGDGERPIVEMLCYAGAGGQQVRAFWLRVPLLEVGTITGVTGTFNATYDAEAIREPLFEVENEAPLNRPFPDSILHSAASIGDPCLILNDGTENRLIILTERATLAACDEPQGSGSGGLFNGGIGETDLFGLDGFEKWAEWIATHINETNNPHEVAASQVPNDSTEVSGTNVDDALNSLGSVVTSPLTYDARGSQSSDGFAFVASIRMEDDRGFLMPADGAILSHTVISEVAGGLGGLDNVKFQVRINGTTEASLTVQINKPASTANESGVTTPGTPVAFSAGDIISIFMDVSGTVSWSNTIGNLWIRFDA